MPPPYKSNPCSFLGKNQKILLEIIKAHEPIFFTDIKQEWLSLSGLELELSKLFRALRRLAKRGIVNRRKEFNPNGGQGNKKQYHYTITEKGLRLLELNL